MRLLFYVFILMVLGFSGCSRTETGLQDLEEEAENIKNTYFAYGEHFELYLLADPFISGQEAEILAHVTRLDNFKPVDRGAASLQLNAGGNNIVQSLQELSEPGIFTFSVLPGAAGNGDIIVDVTTPFGVDTFTIGNITVYNTEAEAMKAAGENAASIVNEISFSKEQSWKIEFATDLLSARPFGDVITTTALVMTDLNDASIIPAKTSGIVVFSNDIMLEGSVVKNGQPLFVISGEGLAENNTAVRFNEARNNFEKAESDFLRLQQLYNDRIVSEKEYLQAGNAYQNAKVLYENLEENFNEQGEVIMSPIDGFINQIQVVNGQFVETGQPLFSVFGNNTLILRAEVPQKYLSQLGSITGATIHDLSGDQYYTLNDLNGKLLSYGRSTGQDNFLIPVLFRFNNNGRFTPGSFVELYIITVNKNDVIVVPVESLVEEMGNYFVFVQHNPEIFEKREVQTGSTDGIYVEITGGLSEQERIVTKGAIMVKLSSVSNNLDPHAGHIH